MKNNLQKTGIAILCSLFVISTALAAHPVSTKKENSPGIDVSAVKKLVYKDSVRLQEIFKDLHQHPELGFHEVRTAEIVAKELQSLGYKVITGIGKTGVAGILENGAGPVVMYRADMDALPIKETTGLPYASSVVFTQEDGSRVPVMHACGHDSHVTWLLGVAKVMVELKAQWKGTLVFVAQPAEEVLLGAAAMVKDNMYEKGVPLPDWLIGMHNKPNPVGTIVNIAGTFMAGSDQIDVTFNGIGGHGSTPHLAKDPVMMAATAVIDYQSIVNRSLSVQKPHVITVGSIMAGTANNIIPNSALLKINIRWFSQADRNQLITAIERVDSSIALANGLPHALYPTTLMKATCPPVVNDTAMVNKVNSALLMLVPASRLITNLPPAMGSEDFPLLIVNSRKNYKYDYINVGAANPVLYANALKEGKEFPFYIHNSNYMVDLTAIPFGTVVGATALLELFRK
jgi:amidohydrolase